MKTKNYWVNPYNCSRAFKTMPVEPEHTYDKKDDYEAVFIDSEGKAGGWIDPVVAYGQNEKYHYIDNTHHVYRYPKKKELGTFLIRQKN